MSAPSETPRDDSDPRGKGVLEGMLLDPLAETKDLRLASRAVKERWPLASDRVAALSERLFDIVDKTEVSVMTKFGPELMEAPADVNAIAAARVIVAMMGQNQADEKAPAQTNIQINVDPAEAGGVKIYLPDNRRD